MNSKIKVAEYLIENNLLPASSEGQPKPTVPEVLMRINTGESLGMDPITAVNSIDIIKGRVSIQSRIISGLLAKNGVAIKLIQDCEPIPGERVPIRDKETNEVVVKDGVIQYYKDPDGEYVLGKPTDWITTIEFIRHMPGLGVVVNRMSFRWSDAVAAGWTSKRNWKSLKRFMMFARCLSRGARAFASDCIAGLYDQFEMMEAAGIDYEVDEEGYAHPVEEVPEDKQLVEAN